jgi:hypothetical protein
MKRYVMANRPNGLSDIVIEDEVEAIESKWSKELWVNYETPADLSKPGDVVADQQMLHEPPDGGAVFRVVVFQPHSVRPLPTPEQMLEYHKHIHSVHVPTLEYLRTAKNATMHKTDTLNYFVLASGELWALSEGKDVLLKPGDVMIQKGCMHGWDNRSDKPAVLVAVLIDAKPA